MSDEVYWKCYKSLIFYSFTFFYFRLYIFFLLYPRETTLMVDDGSYEVASPATTLHEITLVHRKREKDRGRAYLCESDLHAGCGRRTLALLNFLPSSCLSLLFILLTFLSYRLLSIVNPHLNSDSRLRVIQGIQRR